MVGIISLSSSQCGHTDGSRHSWGLSSLLWGVSYLVSYQSYKEPLSIMNLNFILLPWRYFLYFAILRALSRGKISMRNSCIYFPEKLTHRLCNDRVALEQEQRFSCNKRNLLCLGLHCWKTLILVTPENCCLGSAAAMSLDIARHANPATPSHWASASHYSEHTHKFNVTFNFC